MRDIFNPILDGSFSLGLTIFFVLWFVLVFMFVFRRERKSLYGKIEQLPLQEDM